MFGGNRKGGLKVPTMKPPATPDPAQAGAASALSRQRSQVPESFSNQLNVRNDDVMQAAPATSAAFIADPHAICQRDQDELLRLQYDFDFIQNLVSSDYIKYLNKKGYLQQQEFLNYLEYLQYWKQPIYLKLLLQPSCTDVLDMLLKEEIRKEIEMNEDFANTIGT